MADDLLTADTDESLLAGTGSTIEDAAIREQRLDFEYDAAANFSQPIIVRGTNKIFRQDPGLEVQESATSAALTALQASARSVEQNLALFRAPHVSKIRLQAVTPNVITFRVDGDERVFFITTPLVDATPRAFKRLSTLLSIPFAFSKKNPTYLNKTNFEYWLTAVANEDPKPIDFLVEKAPTFLEYEQTNDDGSPKGHVDMIENDFIPAPPISVEAFRVVNILKVERPRGRAPSAESDTDDDAPPEAPPIGVRIPMFADILGHLAKQVQETAPDLEAVLHSSRLGFTDAKGRHYARLLLNGDRGAFRLFGDDFRLSISVDSDFSGDADDFGQVNVSFEMFRLICENGMVARLSGEQHAAMRETYVLDQIRASGIPTDSADEDAVAAQTLMRQQAEATFHAVFDTGVLQVPVSLANAGLDGGALTVALKFFVENTHTLETQLEYLNKPFPDVTAEEFLRNVADVQRQMKLSPELIKFFSVEYLAGDLTKKQTFRTPYDVVNYLSLMARAYDAKVASDVERRAVNFVTLLDKKLRKEVTEEEISYVDQTSRYLNPRYLAADETVEA